MTVLSSLLEYNLIVVQDCAEDFYQGNLGFNSFKTPPPPHHSTPM